MFFSPNTWGRNSASSDSRVVGGGGKLRTGVHANGHNSESPEVASLWKFEGLIYFGGTAEEFACATRRALDEPVESPKRKMRIEAAHAHSTEALAKRLQELGTLLDASPRSAN
jgi:hypothetical protein